MARILAGMAPAKMRLPLCRPHSQQGQQAHSGPISVMLSCFMHMRIHHGCKNKTWTNLFAKANAVQVNLSPNDQQK
jgi:hypothetical protein